MYEHLYNPDMIEEFKHQGDITHDHLTLYSLIKSCEASEGYCTYTDKELAEKMRCSVPHVKRLLKRLAEQGYLFRLYSLLGVLETTEPGGNG